ncbi:hypothetical protein GCM10023187_34550 [Nibrella viscosa]|uniref:CRISPR-associated endonuclease Cas1 n=1 Tax=Nibrella viscosa TaxID=1084524 RepID=A0ABP8KMM5_9BACT
MAGVKSICLHPATQLTYDAVLTALEHDTDILFVDRKGFPVGRLWSNRFGSVSTVRKHQLDFARSSFGYNWVREVLVRKLDNQMAVLDLVAALLEGTAAPRPDEPLQQLQRHRDRIGTYEITDPQEAFASFRGWEGSAGRVYFAHLSRCLPAAYRFDKRTHRGAADAFNCLLNYAYGMLYGHCESALIQAGIDPFIGVMHRDEYNRPVLVYDFIELFRCWADYVVCHLCLQEIVFDEFFDIEQGQYWLNTTGKRILIQSFNDYLAEVVVIQSLSRSRLQHITLEAQKLASTLKKFEI